jgi:glycosyltransferase involved in cell wall biosynthesis
MPVNILYIIDSLTHGGTEKQLVQLIQQLDTVNYRPHICTLKVSESIYNELQMPKVCLNFQSFLRPSIFWTILTLVSFMRQHKIDIVQTFFQDPFLLAAMIKPFSRARLVGAFRDLGFWRTPAETWKMRLAYPLFDGFIANSQAVKKHFCDMDEITPHRIEVVYNGIDLAAVAKNRASSRNTENPVIGIVANLNRPVKRVQDFIEAAAIVHQRHPDMRFVVIGDGPLRKDLEELAKQLGLDEVLAFTGRVANPLEYVATFSIGVITSETEGLCNAILEYMACGVPTVATDAGGNSELLQDGITGFLYPVSQIEDLADLLGRLINQPELRDKMGRAARKAVEEIFSSRVMVMNHQLFYERLLQQ